MTSSKIPTKIENIKIPFFIKVRLPLYGDCEIDGLSFEEKVYVAKFIDWYFITPFEKQLH